MDYIYKPVNPDLLRAKVGVFAELYRKNQRQRLLAQEQKLVSINRNLELEIGERKASEEKVTELNKQLLENLSRGWRQPTKTWICLRSWLRMICRRRLERSACSAIVY